MSRDSSRKVSGSTTHSRGHSPRPIIESTAVGIPYSGPSNLNNLGVLNSGEWQVQAWGSRSVSPLGKIPETVIHVADDGWTTSTNTASVKSQLNPSFHKSPQVSRQRLENMSSSNTMPMGGFQERPSAANQWFPQPVHPEQAGHSAFQDGRFQQLNSPPMLSSSYPAQLLNNFEQMQLSPLRDEFNVVNFRGMPAEDERTSYHIGPPMPAPNPAMLPPPFQQIPGPYNGFPPQEFGYYSLMPPPEPFIDYSFGFNHLGPHQFSMPHPNASNQANLIYPSPPPPMQTSGMPDPRHQLLPQIPYEFSAPPPPFFYPSPPQVLLSPQMSVPLGPPMGSVNPPHMANNPPRQRRDGPLINGRGRAPPMPTPSPPRRPQFGRPPQNKHTGHAPNAPSGGGRGQRRPNAHVPPIPVVPRSALLESFRNNTKDTVWDLKEIKGHIMEFSGDQHGSRFIQQMIQQGSLEERQAVFDEIVPEHTDRFIQDVFGNYVIQKFLDIGTPAQKETLADAVEAKVVHFSLQIYGCRVVQKAVEHVSEEQQTRIIQILERNIFTCIKDAHGNHVIQKLIEIVPPARLSFLRIISENIRDLSTHTYGCRVLQRCLEHLPEEHTRLLLEAIHRHIIDLMKDQYGNYVIQFILQDGQEQDKVRVISQIRGSLIRLAQHKYASNVCEKALIWTDPASRELLIGEIMDAPTEGENPILTMVKDQYANYVLQRALIVVEGDQKDLLYTQVRPLLVEFRKSVSTYSKPLIALERLMEKHFGKQLVLAPEKTAVTEDTSPPAAPDEV